VESALVYPVVLLLVIGLIVGGAGVFRYQEVAHLARQGARWASVHGTQYAQHTGHAAATASDVYNNAVAPGGITLSASDLSSSVSWSPDNSPGSTVTVTVTYQWFPEAFLVGPFNLSSTSSRTMSY
jgi:Flp pilus assembly protein TadG